ncbi:MAG: hypothetical protein WD025_08885 [Bacteriovoracaceae bacterium]
MNTEEFNQKQGGTQKATQKTKELGKDKLQEYGREGLGPVMELFNRYGQEMVEYVKQIATGLEKGGQSLREENPSEEGSKEARELTASWFEEGATFVNKLESQLNHKSSDELLEFVERQGREHPASLFAVSMVAGSLLGRVGKHAYKTKSKSADHRETNEDKNRI